MKKNCTETPVETRRNGGAGVDSGAAPKGAGTGQRIERRGIPKAGNEAGKKRRRGKKSQSVEQFIGLFLRRGKPHADGTPGAFSVRFYVIERAGYRPRRVEIGLHSSDRREAAERALVLLSGLVSTARLWLPERMLNLLLNTPLPLWVPVQELGRFQRENHSSGKRGIFPPRGEVESAPDA